MATNDNTYEPTNAELKLVEVLINPAHRHKDIKALCELADVVRNVYYDAYAKPAFVAYIKDRARDLVDQAVMPIINTYIKQAVAGSHAHGKVVLEMADMHKDSLDVNQRNSGLVGVIDKDTTAEDAAKIYAQMVKGDG